MNGDQCSPRRAPVWPGAPLHNGGPGHPSCAVHNSENSPSSSFSSSTCSPNLFKQIKSTLLFHLTFIWRATPPLSLCFLLFLSVSLSLRRTARLISGLSSGAQGPNKEKSVQFHNVSNYVLYKPFAG